MERIEINVQTGEQKVIQLTAEEIAEIQARPVIESVIVEPTKEELLAQLQALQVKIEALGIK